MPAARADAPRALPDRNRVCPVVAMHAVLASSSVPLFVGALLADWAYAETAQVQWTNFAAWLILGALVLAGLALVWGLIAVIGSARARGRRGASWYLGLLAATFLLGVVNALVHARDAWAAMPLGLVLSVIVLLLALAAAGLGLASARRSDAVPAGVPA
jgi:uncharacterized membrane protein